MPVPLWLALGLMGAGQVSQGLGAAEGSRAAAAQLDAERVRHAARNKQLQALADQEIQSVGAKPIEKAVETAGGALATQQQTDASKIATAFGKVQGGPAAYQGAITSAAASQGRDVGNLEANNARLWSFRQGIGQENRHLADFALERSRISQADEDSRAVLPLEMQAASMKGSQKRSLGGLASAAGMALFQAGAMSGGSSAAKGGAGAGTGGAAGGAGGMSPGAYYKSLLGEGVDPSMAYSMAYGGASAVPAGATYDRVGAGVSPGLS